MKNLSQGLKKLVSLRALDLVFWNCKNIKDEGLIYLSGGLKKLACLENLNVNFGYCSSISAESFISLCEAFQKLVLLKNLELNFSECFWISCIGRQRFCQIMKKIGVNLRSISLCFVVCGLLGEREILTLCKTFKNFNSLEKVRFEYGEHSLIVWNGCEDIRRESEVIAYRWAERGVVCHDEEFGEKEEVEGKGKEIKESELGGFNKLFGCFVKKRERKQKDSEVVVGNQM